MTGRVARSDTGRRGSPLFFAATHFTVMTTGKQGENPGENSVFLQLRGSGDGSYLGRGPVQCCAGAAATTTANGGRTRSRSHDLASQARGQPEQCATIDGAEDRGGQGSGPAQC